MPCWTLLLLLPGQAIESKEYPKALQMKAVAATVRIANRTQRTEGTGVIIGFDKKGTYVLTAAHMVLNTDRFEISTFSEISYPRTVHSYDKMELLAKTRGDVRDLALIRIPTEDRPPAVMPICPLDDLPNGKNFQALSVGCGAGMIPICMLETVVRAKPFARAMSRDPARMWETDIAQLPGRSGGPLLNQRGQLIGLASGASEGKGYYCHAAEIIPWLNDSDYSFLLGEQEKKDKPVKSTEAQPRVKTDAKPKPRTFNEYVQSWLEEENSGMILALIGGGVVLAALLSWLGFRAMRRRRHRGSYGHRHGHRRHHRSSV